MSRFHKSSIASNPFELRRPQLNLPYARHAVNLLCSKLNRRVVTKAPKLGEARSEREISYFVFDHNLQIDHHRGICRPDFIAGRYWELQRLEKLWTNVNGPCPGGNARTAPKVTVRSHYNAGAINIYYRMCVSVFDSTKQLGSLSSFLKRPPSWSRTQINDGYKHPAA